MSAGNTSSEARIQPFQLASRSSASPVAAFHHIGFSADRDRPVTATVGIKGDLPNRVFTLTHPTIATILYSADCDDHRTLLPFLCKKFFMVHNAFARDARELATSFMCRQTRLQIFAGRVFASGDNEFGQCGPGPDTIPRPRRVRIPPTLDAWDAAGAWFASTTQGLYAWGMNDGRLGVGSDNVDQAPSRVPLPGPLLQLTTFRNATFVRVAGQPGWLAFGWNDTGWLGVATDGRRRRRGNCVRAPRHVIGSDRVSRFMSADGMTFGWTPEALLACGDNMNGQCGVGSTEAHINTLTPVALPDDVKGRVDRVVHVSSTFFISGRRCFGCGNNVFGQLGIGRSRQCICDPRIAELPFLVDDVAGGTTTVFLTDGQLMVCGDNDSGQASPENVPALPTPIRLDPPGPVSRVVVLGPTIFLRLTDGSWVGRGADSGDFVDPGPDAERVNPTAWTPLSTRGVRRVAGVEATGHVIEVDGSDGD